MTAVLNHESSVAFALNPGNWLSVCRDLPALQDLSGVELLARTQSELPRHLRYARTKSGVVLLGEDQVEDSESGWFHAEQRLRTWLNESPQESGEFPDEELIETALANLSATMPALSWSRRESRLVVPAGAFSPVEIEIRPLPVGVKVAGLLTTLDKTADGVQAAIGEFLARAQAALRFARAEFNGWNIHIASQAGVADIDVELPLALAGVAAGCRRFIREVNALVRQELAEVYLQSVATAKTGSSHGS